MADVPKRTGDPAVLHTDGNGGLRLTAAGKWIGSVFMLLVIGLWSWQLAQTASIAADIARLNGRWPPEVQQRLDDRIDRLDAELARNVADVKAATALLDEARATCAQAREWADVAETHWHALQLTQEKPR